MAMNNKLQDTVTFGNEINNNMQAVDNQAAQADYSPVVAMFALLLEWEIEDVQEKEEKRKEVS